MYELFKHQDDFLYSEYRHTGLVGGFRSGKSFVGTLKTLSKKIKYPNVNVAYYLPTHDLIKKIALPRFNELLDNQNIPYTLNETDKTYVTPFGKIFLLSMDKPENIVGYEVGYSLIDEVDVVHRNKIDIAFKNILARNSARLPNGDKPQIDFVSTPEGFKFLYNFFVKKPSPNKLLIKAKTTDNKEITQDYLDSLTDEYSEQQLMAYLNGEFVNLTAGSVFSDYDAINNHTDIEVKEGDVLHIGMDFNITKMSAVVHVYEDATALAVDEFVNYYDTQELCDAIKQRYPNHKINIYPDASGNNRRSAGESDFKIIRKFKFNLLSLKKNSLVKDRVNTTNMVFRQNKYKVNRMKCSNYSEALTQLPYKNGEPDKSSGFDHITDAGTYYVNYIFNNTRGRVFI